MLKTLFDIPDVFDTDEHRRRVILNALFIIFILMALLNIIIIVLTMMSDPQAGTWIRLSLLAIVMTSIFLVANRSPKIPSWLTGIIVVGVLIRATQDRSGVR